MRFSSFPQILHEFYIVNQYIAAHSSPSVCMRAHKTCSCMGNSNKTELYSIMSLVPHTRNSDEPVGLMGVEPFVRIYSLIIPAHFEKLQSVRCFISYICLIFFSRNVFLLFWFILVLFLGSLQLFWLGETQANKF